MRPPLRDKKNPLAVIAPSEKRTPVEYAAGYESVRAAQARARVLAVVAGGWAASGCVRQAAQQARD